MVKGSELMDTVSVEKIDSGFLKNVVGGVDYVDVTAGLACPLILSCLGCSIASCVYFAKADQIRNKGNTADYEKYMKKAKNCGIATTALLGASIIDTVVTAAGGERRKGNS